MKNVPIFDDALIEWKERLMAYGFLEKSGIHYLSCASNISPKDVITLTLSYNANFILVNTIKVSQSAGL